MDVALEIVDKVSKQQHDKRAPDEVISEIRDLLVELTSEVDDIVSAIVTSCDGLPWTQVLPEGLDVKRFSAMSSALLALSMTMAKEAQRGKTKNLLIETEEGNIYVLQAGPSLLLTVFTKSNSNLGLTLAHTRRTSEKVEKIKSNYDQQLKS